jgi:O-antigen/teichoic acid export membrane protein
MTIVRNALTNVAERIISAVLMLVAVPIQIRLLGMEAYGLLGFVASLQVLLSILDFGLAPTVIREVAADTAEAREHSRALIQTFSGVYWSIALAAGTFVVLVAPWLASHWLHAGSLSDAVVVLAIRLIAISVLLRWPVSLYAGAIAGAQRLDAVNAIRIASSLLKILGGLLVLLYFRTLASYLVWLALAAVAEIACYMTVAARLVPNLTFRPGFSRSALEKVWRFSLHMNVMSMLTALFVQADRLMISRLLPIAELGFYSVAYSLAMCISILQNVVSTALFPALAQGLEQRDAAEIRKWCAIATEIVMYLACGAGSALIFYGYDLLTVWISHDSAARASGPAAILAAGFVAAAAVSVPYTLAIAAGETSAPLAVNAAAGVVYLPVLYWLVHTWGIAGAAWAWVGLNTYYLVVLLPLLQRRLSMEPVLRWFARHVLPFVGTALLVIGGGRVAIRSFHVVGLWPSIAALGVSGALYAVVALAFVDPSVRVQVNTWRRRYWPLQKAPIA